MPTDIPEPQEGAPADPPAPSEEERIAAIVTAAIDARIPNLQSGYDTRLNEKDATIAALQTQLRQSSMDEDEIADEQQAELQKKLDEQVRENEALRAAQTYPDAYAKYQELIAAPTAEEQMKLIQKYAAATEAPPPPAEDPAPPPPPVDPNNPRTDQPLDANAMDADKAARIIKSFGNIWPGRE
jgi:Skp family chaperone for outer membrane proteins